MHTFSLQKPEESIYRPASIDDEFLLSETDNGTRLQKAEVDTITINETINAIASQIRQMQWGTTAGRNWPDIPPIDLETVAYVLNNIGTTVWNAGQDIFKGQPVYATSIAQEVKIASKDAGNPVSIIGFAREDAYHGNPIRILHEGHILDGFTGLVPGDVYFLGSAGSVTNVAPTGSGEILYKVGVAQTSTNLLINLGEPRIRA
jgi:hypothetical protein